MIADPLHRAWRHRHRVGRASRRDRRRVRRAVERGVCRRRRPGRGDRPRQRAARPNRAAFRGLSLTRRFFASSPGRRGWPVLRPLAAMATAARRAVTRDSNAAADAAMASSRRAVDHRRRPRRAGPADAPDSRADAPSVTAPPSAGRRRSGAVRREEAARPGLRRLPARALRHRAQPRLAARQERRSGRADAGRRDLGARPRRAAQRGRGGEMVRSSPPSRACPRRSSSMRCCCSTAASSRRTSTAPMR